MNEIFKPLYDKAIERLEGKTIGTVNCGIPEAFVEVSKELIGYNCFGYVVRDALLEQMSQSVKRFKEKGLYKPENCAMEGDPSNEYDVAFEIVSILAPSIIETSYVERSGKHKIINEMFAFVPYDDMDIQNISDILGEWIKPIIDERNWNINKSTEFLFKTIVHADTEMFKEC